MKLRGRLCIIVVAVGAALSAGRALAEVDYWRGPPGGYFDESVWWVDGSAPTPSDSVVFDAGGGDVLFRANATTQDLVISGSVRFVVVERFPLTYSIAGGGGDVYVRGAALTLGSAGMPALNLDVADLITLSNASLWVGDGSTVTAARLVATANGTITVNGGSTTTGPSSLNLSGDVVLAPGKLMFSNAAVGQIAGTVSVGAAVGYSTLEVTSAARVTAGGIEAGTDGNPGPYTGYVFVDGTGSSLTQSLGASLTLGAPSSGLAKVLVTNGGRFVGGGPVTVNATGLIDVSGGTFIANGNVLVNTAGGTGPSLRGDTKVYVSGPSSVFTQEGAGTFILGHASSGAAGLLVENNGTLNTGTGDLVVHATGRVDVNNGGKVNANGNVLVNTSGGSGPNGVVVVSGPESAFTQVGAGALTIGHPSTGDATISVQGSAFSTGTGLTTVRRTGLIEVLGGTFSLNGDMLVDGGQVVVDPSRFSVARGRNITISSGGVMDTRSGLYHVENGSTVTVLGGSALEFTDLYLGGKTGNGTLVVDGIRARAGSDSNLYVGKEAPGVATFRNGASGSFRDLYVGRGPSGQGVLNVESGAKVTFETLDIGADGGSAFVTVSG
ncbi:MAG TPA: hypothetical protein VM243_05550 [Phycisphaerae bacterium]|nr:hypothetical protein [Phycisphaerae bacterium]